MISNKTKKIKIAFIGTGYIARQHLKILRNFKDVDIIGYLGSGGGRLENFGRRFGTLRQLIDSGVDLVFLCTPPYARFEFEQELIKGNINYFVEKPPAIDRQRELLKILSKKKNGLNIIPGFQWRFFGFNNFLKECVKNDQVRFIYAERLLTIPFQDWKINKDKSGGIMYEFLIHVIDYCQYLLGVKAEFVGYFANKPRIGKNDDRKYNLNDSEVMVFRVGDVLCNIFGSNYSLNNNFFNLTIVGQKNIYRISFDKNGNIKFEIIADNKVRKTFREKFENPYIKENTFVINQIKSGIKTTDKYLDSLRMSRRIIKTIRDGKLFA